MDLFSSTMSMRDVHESNEQNVVYGKSKFGIAHRMAHPFGIPDRSKDQLSLSNPASRSNSSNSLSPSAKSSSSMESFLNFPRLSLRPTTLSRPSTIATRATSPLPELFPPIPESVSAFDNLIRGPLATFMRFSNALGQDVLRQAQMVKSLFELQREFILISTGFSFNDGESGSTRHLTTPLGSGPAQAAKMREIKNFAARHAYSHLAPHLHFVADTISALGWVVAGDRPSNFIRESYDGGKHHVKHIPGMDLKSNAISPPNAMTEAQVKVHTGWVNSWQNLIIDLDAYVRDYHTRGLKWKKGN